MLNQLNPKILFLASPVRCSYIIAAPALIVNTVWIPPFLPTKTMAVLGSCQKAVGSLAPLFRHDVSICTEFYNDNPDSNASSSRPLG